MVKSHESHGRVPTSHVPHKVRSESPTTWGFEAPEKGGFREQHGERQGCFMVFLTKKGSAPEISGNVELKPRLRI